METTDIIKEFAEQKPNTDSSLNTDIIKEFADSFKTEEAPVDIETEVIEPQVVEEVVDTQTTLDITEGDVEEDEILEEEDFIKERTGGKYSSWEELDKVINQDKPIAEFENETSRAIYNMLAEGKINEVFDILQKKSFADGLKEKSDEDVLKAYIKSNNPEFDKEDVEDEYAEKYLIDEFSFDDAKLKREQKKLNQRIKTDVESAKEFFNKSSEDIKFPQYAPKEEIEEDDSELQVERSKFLSSLNESEKRVNSLPFAWKDEKTNISINGKFEIPAQELTKYRSMAENLEDYYTGKYYQEGKYKSDTLLKDLYIADNFDKILNSVVSQAVNQTRLELLKKNKNITVDVQESGSYKPSGADEEKNMYDQLFMGHLKR